MEIPVDISKRRGNNVVPLWLFYVWILMKMFVCPVELKYFAAVLWAKLTATGKCSTCVELNENTQV